jgi:glyoxylate reductase
MTKAKVLMTRIVPEQAMEKVRGQCDLAVWEEDCAVPQDWLVKNIGDAQGLFCLLTDKVDEEILLAATRLQVVSAMAVGFDNIDVSACTKRGIPIGNTPGALTETTADFTFT